MKILTKHVFPIYKQIYKGIDLPNNYVDGIIIKSNRDMTIPIGAKCIYSRSIKNNKYLKVVLPFPIKHDDHFYDGEFIVLNSYLATINESSLLYKHNMLYVDKNTKATNINIDKILLDTICGISTTVVIDYKYYNIYFLNKLLQLPYEYRPVIFSICEKNPKDYLAYRIKKSYVGITILNLNDCKPSFSNNFKGVGIKVQLYQYNENNVLNVYKIMACLYSNNYKDLYYTDGIRTPKLGTCLDWELDKTNKFIRTQREIINKHSKKSISKKSIPEKSYELKSNLYISNKKIKESSFIPITNYEGNDYANISTSSYMFSS